MNHIAFAVVMLCGHAVFSADLKPVYGQPKQEKKAIQIKNERSPFGQLLRAIIDKKSNQLNDLLEHDKSLLDQTDERGMSALHYAAMVGNMAAVKMLHDKIKRRWFQSCLLDKEDIERRTPVHLAISNGHLDVVKYFIEKADSQVCGKQVRLAVRYQQKEIMEYLVDRPANRLPGHYAVRRAIEEASICDTSSEILYALGDHLDFSLAGDEEAQAIKAALNKIFKRYRLPIAFEFVRGYQMKLTKTHKLEEIIGANNATAVGEYMKHPQRYIDK